MHENRGSATHVVHDARETWQCHACDARCAGNVAVPHMWCTMREKRGSATHPTCAARETWQCHESHVCCAGNVAVPHIPRSRGPSCAGESPHKYAINRAITTNELVIPSPFLSCEMHTWLFGVVCRLLVSRLRLRGAGFSPPEQTQHHLEPVAFYTMSITPPSRASPRWPPRRRPSPSPSRRPGWVADRPPTSPRP